MKHAHDDEDHLTFACPACIDRVKSDQHLAAIAEQPDRPLTVAWSARGKVTIEAKYLDDEQPSNVAERNWTKLENEIGIDDFEILEAAFGKKL